MAMSEGQEKLYIDVTHKTDDLLLLSKHPFLYHISTSIQRYLVLRFRNITFITLSFFIRIW